MILQKEDQENCAAVLQDLHMDVWDKKAGFPDKNLVHLCV